jgi:oxaloacetate decarboxylase alpha subunit
VAAKAQQGAAETYSVAVDGQLYTVQVGPEGSVEGIAPGSPSASLSAATETTATVMSEELPAPLAGNIFKVLVSEGEKVEEGDVLLIMEAMKMETEIRAPKSGVIQGVFVKEGSSVAVGETLFKIA